MAARRAAPISTKNSPSAEPPGRIAAGALFAPLVLASVLLLAGVAFATTPRTIVVRGQALTSDGQPIAGARVQVRGTANVVALTDDNGRYTLSVPLGMPAALRQLPFKMEVRAEGGGHKLSLAGGGQSLVLDASWNAAKGVVLVKSNREAAAQSVAASLEIEEATVAPIEANFGGAAKAGANGSFSSEAVLAGSTRVAGTSVPTSPKDSAAAVPLAKSPAPAAAVTGAVLPTASASALPTASSSASPGGTRSPASSVAVPLAALKSVPARRDTLRIGDPAAAASPPGAQNSVAKGATSNRAARAAQVRAIASLAGPDSLAPAGPCRCSVRGTVEINWTRPLEDHTSVLLVLEAPGAQPAEVSLFMGAPREFRFGPLPCGVWRLSVKAKGKLRYTDTHGDTARVIPCAGTVETRVVLVPAKR